jgi:hypothetical protein
MAARCSGDRMRQLVFRYFTAGLTHRTGKLHFYPLICQIFFMIWRTAINTGSQTGEKGGA